MKGFKMSKSILSLLVALMMILSMMPMSAFAALQTAGSGAISVTYDDISIKSVSVNTTDDGALLNPTYTHILTIVPQDGYVVDNINAVSWSVGLGGAIGAVELLGYVDLGNDQYQIVSQNEVEVSVNGTPDPTKDEIEVRYVVDGDLYAYDVLEKGDTPLVPTPAPTKEGYTFSGWVAASDGTVYTDTLAALSASETYTAQFTLGTHTLTYYRGAQADASDYKCILELPGGAIVELYNNDGTDHPTFDVTNVAYGSTVELGAPSLPGYTFAGWKDESGYIHPAGALYTVKGDMTLTATWTTAENEDDCLVRFVSEGTVYDAFLTYNGQTITIPAVDPVIAGMEFGGWEYNGNVYSNTGVKTLDVVADANREMTLTAVWTPAAYDVLYVGYGEDKDLPYGKYVLAEAPTNDGFEFVAWEDAATGAYYDAKAAITLSSDMTFNAVWAAEAEEEYIVKFYGEDGDLFDIAIVTAGGSVTAPAYTAGKVGVTYQWINTVGKTYADPGDVITVEDNLIYTAKAVAEAEYNVTTTVKPAMSGVVTAPTKTFKAGEIVSIAINVPEGYVLKAVDAIGAADTPVVDSLVETAAGAYLYYFTMPAEDAAVTVTLEEIPVGSTVVKFVADGELYDYIIVTKGTNGIAPAEPPVKAGYTFEYWKLDTTTVDAGAPFAVAADAADEMVFQAVWTAENYTVNYDTVGGEPQPLASAHNYEDAITLAAAPAKDGFEFIGWVEQSTGFVYAAGAAYTVKGDVLFTAKWEEIPPAEYIVRFADQETNQIFGYEIVKENDTVIAPAGPSFGGKTFVAWENGGIQVLAGNPTPAITADTTFYATYDINTHSVTSVVEQCEVNPSSMTNVPVGALVEFVVTANVKYKVDAVSIAYNDGMSVVTKTLTANAAGNYSFYMPDADVTITAIALQNEFAIFPQPETYAQITAPTTAEAGAAVVFGAVSIDDDYVLSNVVVTTVTGVPVAVSTYINGGATSYLFEMPAEDVLIYAQTRQAELSVTFLNDDNTLLGIVPVGSGDYVTAPVATKDGFTFNGWILLPDGADFDPAADEVTENLIVRATYIGDDHTVAAGLVDNLEALSAKCTVSSGNENSSDLLQTALNAETGKTVYFTVAAEYGYVITDIAVVSAVGTNLVVEPTLREKEDIDNITYYTYSFTMPAEDVKLDIYTVPMSFKVSVNENLPEGGDYTINGYFTSNLMIAQGDDVTVAVTAAEGYAVKSVKGTYIDNLGNVAEITGNWDGALYTFKMIAKDVTVDIEYETNIYGVDIQTSNFATYKPDASVNPAVVVESLDDALTSKGLIELVGGTTENYTNGLGQIYAIPANGEKNVGNRVAFTVKEYTGYDLSYLTVTYDNDEKSCVITEKNGVYYFDMPADDVKITATFVEETYTVTKDAASETNGTITINNLKENIVSADYKDEVEVVVTPEDGYQITKIYYVVADDTVLDFDAASYAPAAVIKDALDTAQSISFHMPASDVTVYAEYEKIDYTISAVYTPGEATVDHPITMNVDDLVTFKTEAEHGYFIDKVFVTDDTTGKRIDTFTATTSEDEIYGAYYNFVMPASSVTITVVTIKDEYSVKYYDAGGLVGFEDVDYRAPANVDEYIAEVVNAKSGYHFIGWYSDDVETPVPADAPSIDKNDFIVIDKAVIRAVYAKDEIDVVFNATTNGTVTCNGNNAAYTLDTTLYGDTVKFTAVPDVGYVIDTVSVTSTDADGFNLDIRYTENGGEYTFVIPATYKADVHTVQAEDVIVNVTFKKDTFTLTKGACDPEGTVAVNGKVTTDTVYNYLYQDAVTITATPDNGYYVSKIAALKADGSEFKAVSGTAPAVDTAAGDALTLSFEMPAEDLSFTVDYEKINYSIDVATTNAANADYGVVAKDVETAVLDQVVTLTVTEKEGYDLETLSVTTKDGITIIDLEELVRNGNVLTTSFEMPAEAVIVTATFTTEKYEVIKGADSEAHGKIESVDADGVTHLENTYLYDFGDAVALKVTADDGWYIASIKVIAESGAELAAFTGTESDVTATVSFTMPAEDVEITVEYAEIVYDITTVFDAAQGKVETVPAATATVDDPVAVTVTPEYGYVIENVFVATASDEHIALSKDSDGKYHFTMPAEDVTVTATFVKDVYTVTFKDWNGDILEIDYVDYKDAATAPADPEREGYTFIGWDTDFSEVTNDLLVTAQYKVITSKLDVHSISFTGVKHGKVTVQNGKTADYGETIVIVADPDDGWRYESISVLGANGKYVPVSFVKEDKDYVTTLSFVMPDCDVKITVSFEEHSASQFTDTRTDDWFYEAVEFVTDRGYFVGVSKTLFAPHQKMTRSMFVAVLARLEGVDLKAYKGTDFEDVKESAYYAPAVKWASENGIVKGYSKTEFAPDNPVTREEMCAIMYRYADYAGLDTTIKNKDFMKRYVDVDEISPYAKKAVEWAIGVGLIHGTSRKTIAPTEYATRAQVAQIIKNLCDKVVYE